MSDIRTAVIGAGYFGSHHARKFAQLPGSTLVAVADTNRDNAERLSAELGCGAETDHRRLIGRVDAVSIATPTAHHFAVARDFLDAGVHVLVEKPLCASLDEADALIALAAEKGRILQVGHLERFNPAVTALEGMIDNPGYIECERISPFRPRGTDVNVVLDMMIHDLDLVLSLVGAPVETIDAIGVPVLSEADDIASARIRFTNGCVASLTASRVSWKTHRLLRIFQLDAYLVADLNKAKVSMIRKALNEAGQPELSQQDRQFETGDPLKLEVASFIEAVRSAGVPKVTGSDGRAALAAALEINRQMAEWSALQSRRGGARQSSPG